MTDLVLLILIFLAAGLAVLATNLVLGRLVRPDRPSQEKGEVYECGESPIGTAWIQFDVRFYVVALLFVIFDVEMAFFFPWAIVFGSAARAADESQPDAVRMEAVASIQPQVGTNLPQTSPWKTTSVAPQAPDSQAMHGLAWIAFADLLVFFTVLLVGFAYLWRRGDLIWVRSLESQ